ncbi:alpha/beta hydrolase [Proteobacteria bacterium 005FR1]|nr:alpha/beta hydrolase [Proteobacteria bacterium 005FR1]
MNISQPAWFQQAIASTRTSRHLDVSGCAIYRQTWGDKRNPGLVLLHGNGAHAHWWDFIAPFFAEEFFVVAFDLSGMGDSDHREAYTPDSYADEVAAVVAQEGFTGKPLLIGHSFGARVVFKALQKYPEEFAGVIMVDAPFHPPDHKFEFHKRREKPVKPHRVYRSLVEAKERFRLFPEQPCANDYIVDYIATHSIRETPEGWSWKFDPKIYSRFDFEGLLSTRPRASDKLLAMIYGQHSSLYTESVRRYNEELFRSLGLPAPICLADAYHHLLLDQPLAFVEVLKRVLQESSFG